jgi:hypothetical protein
MPFKIKVEMEDAEGHALRVKEDLTGQAVIIRMEDGTEVQGHIFKRGEDLTGEEAEGHAFRVRSEDMTGEDAEGHIYKRIDLEVDDAQANLLRAATAQVRAHLRALPRRGRGPGPRLPGQVLDDM